MATVPHKRGGRTVLITGASSGLGYELSKLFARDGYALVLVARNRERLDGVAGELIAAHGVSVTVLAKDLSLPTSAPEIRRELEEQSVTVDILVNNAGFATYGPFAETSADEELALLQTNIVALTHLTKLFVGDMLRNRRGRILNVASTAAFLPGPLMAVYYASKAYVLSFSEALANELQGSGVTVTALCPGPTQTGFQKRASMEDSKLMNGPQVMDAPTVARIGYQGLMRGKTVVVLGLANQLLPFAVRLVPRGLQAQMARRVQERKSST